MIDSSSLTKRNNCVIYSSSCSGLVRSWLDILVLFSVIFWQRLDSTRRRVRMCGMFNLKVFYCSCWRLNTTSIVPVPSSGVVELPYFRLLLATDLPNLVALTTAAGIRFFKKAFHFLTGTNSFLNDKWLQIKISKVWKCFYFAKSKSHHRSFTFGAAPVPTQKGRFRIGMHRISGQPDNPAYFISGIRPQTGYGKPDNRLRSGFQSKKRP